jgi:hypothetical protein
MKELVELLAKNSIVCKKLESVDISKLGSRKRIKIYLGVDIKGYYCTIFEVDQKSRFLSKDSQEMNMIFEKLEEYHQGKIGFRYILIKASMCSKAKVLLEVSGWNVWRF